MKCHGGFLNTYFLNERIKSEKTTYCMIPTICCSGNGKIIE
jgi:hypothetical protein